MLSAYSSLVVPATTLLSLPHLRSTLGDDGLAATFLAWSIARTIVALDLGLLGMVVPNAVASARGGASGLRSYIGRAIRLLMALASGFAVLAVVAAFAGLELPGSNGTLENLGLLFSAVAMSLSLQMMTLMNGVLAGLRRFGLIAVSSTVGSAAFLIAIWTLVNRGDAALVVLITAGQYFGIALLGSLALRRPGPTQRAVEESADFKIVNWRMQAIGVGGILAGQGPTLAAGLALGPGGIVAVAIGQQYGSVVRLGGLSLGNFFISGFSNASASKALELVRRASRVWIPATLLGGVGFAGIAPVLVRVWFGADTSGPVVACSGLAALSAAFIVSTLPASSYLRTIRRLGPENALVVGSIGVALLTLVGAVVWRDPVALWLMAALATGVIACAFNTWVWFSLRALDSAGRP